MSLWLYRSTSVALMACMCPAAAQGVSTLSDVLTHSRFSLMDTGSVAAPWRVMGLPGQKSPLTRFDIQRVEGESVLRVRTDASYGNLLIDAHRANLTSQSRLRWRWQLERGLSTSDLRRKNGDDTPVKVCALFDMALDGMSFGEQSRLRMARTLSGEPLPAATLCYVWDRLLPKGQILSNVFSSRVRYLVVSDGPAQPGVWQTIERRLAQDFLQAFGNESAVVPPLIALAVGADADNALGSSLAWVGDIQLDRP